MQKGLPRTKSQNTVLEIQRSLLRDIITNILRVFLFGRIIALFRCYRDGEASSDVILEI